MHDKINSEEDGEGLVHTCTHMHTYNTVAYTHILLSRPFRSHKAYQYNMDCVMFKQNIPYILGIAWVEIRAENPLHVSHWLTMQLRNCA